MGKARKKIKELNQGAVLEMRTEKAKSIAGGTNKNRVVYSVLKFFSINRPQ